MKNRIRLILSFTIPYIIFISIIAIILLSIFIPLNKEFYFNRISLNVELAKSDIESRVDDIVNSLTFLSSYAEIGINTSNIAQSITNVKKFGNYFDVFYCDTVPYSRGGTFISSRITYPSNYDQTAREWYQNASKDRNSLYITAPYIDFNSGNLVITFINKIMINNRLAGYFGIDFDNMNAVVGNANNDFIESINVVTEDGLYVTHEKNEYLMNQDMLIFNDDLFSSYKNNMQDSGIYIKNNYWYTVRKINNAPWYIAVRGDASYYFNLTKYLILFLAAFGILFIIGELIIVSISLIPLSDRLDDIIVSLESMANGDFASRIREYKLMDSSARKLSNVMEKMQRNIGKTMYKIKTGVEEVNKNGEAIANVSIELSNKANEQSVSLNNLIDAINAISSSIEYASKKTDYAKTMSDESFENTKVGVKMIGEIRNNMNEITEASNQISHIIETIQAIASQTNILALNAAVEAARAGDQGRGFAVVASEIRKLATTVSQATKDITGIVENAVTKIDNGSTSVSKTSKTLDQIAKSAVETSSILLDISSSSNEEIERINNINNDIGIINEIMIKNEELSKEASDASSKTSKMAEDIVKELSFFKFGHSK